MVNRKVTPAIEKFVQSNCTLTSNTLSALIEKRFKIKITSKALEPYIARARAESIAVNDAKVEAVRSQILDDGGLQAGKYLKYLDENIEALNNLLKNADCVKIETARDYVAVSQALLKSLSTVLEFVKPEKEASANVSHKPDLSRLSIEQLRQLRDIKLQLEGDPSESCESKPP